MNGLVKFALGVANVPDHLVSEVDASIPGAQRLIAAAKKLEPSVHKLAPLIEQAQPIIMNEILPVIKAEYPDLMTLLPIAQEILAFVQGSTPAVTVAATSPAAKDSKFGG